MPEPVTQGRVPRDLHLPVPLQVRVQAELRPRGVPGVGRAGALDGEAKRRRSALIGVRGFRTFLATASKSARMLTVRDIATMTELDLTVAAGADGLASAVSWLHVSELAD